MNYTHPETLVETQWLAEHLNDRQLRIIEMDLDSEAYDREHISGSIFWSTFDLLRPNLKILNPEAMGRLLSNSGIDRNTTVVAVHNNYTGTSGWIFWLLKLCGHRDVRILNGGRPKWQKENFPLTIDKTEHKQSNYQIYEYQNYLRISSAEVKECFEKENSILLDVRTLQEYKGEIYLRVPPQAEEKAGHIPGAVKIYYEQAHNSDGTFKSAEELHEIYGGLISTDKMIIPYCAIGARSAHTWFVLKYLLGCDRVTNYDGSWNEWSRLADYPIETNS